MLTSEDMQRETLIDLQQASSVSIYKPQLTIHYSTLMIYSNAYLWRYTRRNTDRLTLGMWWDDAFFERSWYGPFIVTSKPSWRRQVKCWCMQVKGCINENSAMQQVVPGYMVPVALESSSDLTLIINRPQMLQVTLTINKSPYFTDLFKCLPLKTCKEKHWSTYNNPPVFQFTCYTIPFAIL